MFSQGELCHTKINVALCTVIHPHLEAMLFPWMFSSLKYNEAR